MDAHGGGDSKINQTVGNDVVNTRHYIPEDFYQIGVHKV
jgi:hypothetical protein